MNKLQIKIQTVLIALVLLVGGTYANSAHAIFGLGDIVLVDIAHDITVEIPAIIEQVVLTAVNDSTNLALKAALAPRQISDHVNYAINLTNDVYVDRALVTSNDSNTALTKTLIAQQQNLATSGGVNAGQIAQQRAITTFNPYSINAQIGNQSASIVDVFAMASSPNASPLYQQQAMSGNASAVLSLAQQGANKDIAAGAGSKSAYSGTTGNLSVATAGKDVNTALDSIVSSSFGNQQKPQNNISAMFVAIADTFIKVLNQQLVGPAAGTPISSAPKTFNVTH